MKKANIINELILEMKMDTCDKTLFAKIKSLPNIDLTDSGGMTLLMAACVNDRLELAKALIDLGADINIQDQKSRGYTALHAAVENRKYDAVKFLLENNADPNKQDKYGNIPLLRACHFDIEIIELLVKYGSDYCKDNYYGNSAYTSFAAYPEVMKIFDKEK